MATAFGRHLEGRTFSLVQSISRRFRIQQLTKIIPGGGGCIFGGIYLIKLEHIALKVKSWHNLRALSATQKKRKK
jgi:hypothetical protein